MYKVILHKNAARYYRNADKKLQVWRGMLVQKQITIAKERVL